MSFPEPPSILEAFQGLEPVDALEALETGPRASKGA